METESPQAGTTYSSNELAAELLPAFGGVAVTVHTFSGDSHFSHCYGACARDFIPVTTVGTPTPGAGVNPDAVGMIRRADGTEQVTHNGHPLYFYNQEQPAGRQLGTGPDRDNGQRRRCPRLRRTFNLINP